MTIEELIAELQQYGPHVRVLVTGYEDGYDEPDVTVQRVRRGSIGGFWWKGQWQDDEAGEAAVVIGR